MMSAPAHAGQSNGTFSPDTGGEVFLCLQLNMKHPQGRVESGADYA
jgi:hypothetical protein